MSKVACLAKLTAEPGRRDDLVAAFSEMLEAVEGEPGTEVYLVHLDASNDDVVWFYELYTDDDAFAAHAGSPAMKAASTGLKGLLAGRPELFFLRPRAGKGLAL